MAKYIVETSKKEKYKKNYEIPFINIIPAVVWSIPIHQKLFPDASLWVTLGVCGVFVAAYIVLSMLPVIAVVPCVAGVIIFTALFWAPADHIGNNIVRIIVKTLILAIALMIEFCIWTNATLPWIETRYPDKPNIRRIEEEHE